MYLSNAVFLAYFLALFDSNTTDNENLAVFLDHANEILLENTRQRNFAYWNFTANMSDATQSIYMTTALESAEIWRSLYQKSLKFELPKGENQSLTYQIKMLQTRSIAKLSVNDYAIYLNICTTLERLYVDTRFCSNEESEKNCSVRTHPNLTDIFAKQRDPDVLKYYWQQFYAAISKTKLFNADFIRMHKRPLLSKNLHKDSEILNVWWVEDQNMFQYDVYEVYKSLAPFYFQLHAFVRHRLYAYYGPENVSQNGPIPMHLLGSIWADKWSNIQDIILPYPNKGAFDISSEMKSQNYSVEQMFKIADHFMQSLGLRSLPPSLWKTCIGTPSPNLNIYCRARSFDFYKDDDICVRSCTPINHEGFYNVYHEMGHLQYFLQYAKQPFLLRQSPTPALHETIGDVIALSAMSPKYLRKIGLLKNYTYDAETRINYLFRLALDKIVFIPFALSSDDYFWSILRDQVETENLSCAFWNYREDYAGVVPPVERRENDFDVLANYFIGGDIKMLPFVRAILLQFQLYQAASNMTEKCKGSQFFENCNFYKNQNVGKAFRSMMSIGAGESYENVLKKFGNIDKISDKALKLYFKPLIKWLEKTNRENNITVGWPFSQKCQASAELNELNGSGYAVQKNLAKFIIFPVFLAKLLIPNFY